MTADLYNKKTIEKLCSSVIVSLKQKKASQEWLELLKSNSLEDEKRNYFKFAEIVLQDILGYDIRKDLSHEEGHVEFPFKDQKGNWVVAFEAKGTLTNLFSINLGRKKEHETPIKQTWNYMGSELNLKYGICTNYKDFVLLDRTKGYSKYHLFDFEEIRKNNDKLKEFIAIFSKESIIDNKFLDKLYSESIIEEREFTSEFYKLFHETRLMLVKEFQDNGATKEQAVHFAQLLLNRLMFVFFAEDSDLLEKRLFEDTLIKFLKSAELFDDKTTMVSDAIQNMFTKLDKGSDSPIKIFGFNGGLFRESIPRAIYFTDLKKKDYFKELDKFSKLKNKPALNEDEKKLVETHKNKINPIITNMLIMASYDFNTEVNVNILGHIFEQSLNDIEDLQQGGVSKRKKDGIFYTPEYITDYICKNTIIPHLSKKGVNEIDALIQEYQEDIEVLENKFKSLKVLDPACGSGAFLIKAVEVLIEIYKRIQEVKQARGEYTKSSGKGKKKVEGLISLGKYFEEDEARDIIQNNIFGVDLNEESVEITRLSLFLKIARKDRKLINLENNIKCGNSLIDNKLIDQNHAFNWEEQFKPIMDVGGFDVIIGNPPYIRAQFIDNQSADYYKKKYSVAYSRVDTSLIFFEKAYSLLNNTGDLAFISTSQGLVSDYGSKFRLFLLNKLVELNSFGDKQIFEGALTYTAIFKLSKKANTEFVYQLIKSENPELGLVYDKKHKINFSSLGEDSWFLDSANDNKIYDKFSKLAKYELGNKFSIYTGLFTGLDEILVLPMQEIKSRGFSFEFFKKFVRPIDMKFYTISEGNEYIFYPYLLDDSKKTKLVDIKEIKLKDPKLCEYLHEHKERLYNRIDSRQKFGDKSKGWWGLVRFGKYEIFSEPKILFQATTRGRRFVYDEKFSCFGAGNIYSIKTNDFSILALLNSKLFNYILFLTCPLKAGGYRKYSNKYVSNLQMPVLEKQISNKLSSMSKNLAEISTKFNQLNEKFLKRLSDSLKIEKITRRLEEFYLHDFNDFIAELKKQGINLSLTNQDEWEDYFNKYKLELLALKTEIDKIDFELDNLIYSLYGITTEEKQIIEEYLKK